MAAMVRADPGLAVEMERLRLLDGERARALTAADPEAAARVARRMADIQRRYLRAQAAALRDVRLAERVDHFNALLRHRMMETAPDARALLRRYTELQRGGRK